MNLIALFDEASHRAPATPAIIDFPRGATRVTSFATLQARSAHIAALFATSGIREGDGIVVLVPMSAELYAVIAAALRIGAVPVFIDPTQAAAQLALARSAIVLKAFVGSPAACLFRWGQADLRAIRTAFSARSWFPGATPLRAANCLSPAAKPVDVLRDAPAMLTFTSGSTGAAKGLLRSHGLLLTTQDILLRHLDLRPGSVNLATMPALVMANLGRGVTSLIPEGDLRRPATLDPAHLADCISRWEADSMLASPAVVDHVAAYCRRNGKSLESLRSVFIGGAPVFVPLMEQAARIAPQAQIAALYGSTEAEPIAMIRLDEIDDSDRAAIAQGGGLPAGRHVGEIALAIVKDLWGRPLGCLSTDDFAAIAIPPGDIGEIVVSGPHVSVGYLGGRGDNETKFRVNDTIWHRTGDSGRFDPRGRLWLTGRCHARIDTKERAIYPLMVEAALAEDTRIARTAYISHHGQRLLVVELRSSADNFELETLARALPWAGIEKTLRLQHIPVDRRHEAKTDYPALLLRLDTAKASPGLHKTVA